jgi:S1-C subfamily serine protease
MTQFKTILVTFLALFTLVACSNVQTTIVEKKKGIVAVVTNKDGSSGLGTGFFIDENFILTNHHVIENVTKIEIALENSNKTYEAELIYSDKASDIAAIRVKDLETFKKENEYITLSMTTHYRLLDEVYAIGHPWSLYWTISKGVVSRDLFKKPNELNFFLQTDANIFNGNSGGPLLNTNGQVIGINSNMIVNEGGSYGLAIPITIVEKVLADFQKYKEVRWPIIGVTLDINSIKQIAKDSPAEKAGLQVGDVIVSVKTKHGMTITEDGETLMYALSITDYEDIVLVNIERNGDLITLSVQPTYKNG